jgi:hypothetical protein
MALRLATFAAAVDGPDFGSAVSIAAIFVEGAGSDMREQIGLCSLEIGARLVKGCGRTVAILAGMQTR